MENKLDILKLKAKYVRISSEDKTSNSPNNSRFEVNLNQTGTSIDRVAGYAVKYAACPNIFPNVPSYANVLSITKQTGAVVYDITIPVGQYTLSNFITQLQSSINSVIGPDSVTITETNGFLSFTWVGDQYSFNPDQSTINDIIGITSQAQGVFFTTATLSNPVNLTGESELYIHSKTLNNAGLIEPSGSFAVVDILPLNVQYGGVAYSNYNDIILHEKQYVPYESLRTFRTVDIVLRNRNGEVLVLPDNFYFNMILIIYYE